MMKREQIFLSKNFTVIESDIPFTLKFNIKDNTANSAEDVINFKSGWYIFDNNKLLPQYVDGIYNLPKYNCWIEYDETLGTTPPNWYTCYINPKSVESLSSEVTELDPAQLAGLRQDIQTNGGKINGLELLVNGFKSANHSDLSDFRFFIDGFQTSNHADLGAVKSSVDALQVSNHADLGFLKSSFLISQVSYVSIIPVSTEFPYTWVLFSLPFFDTFISLRYATVAPHTGGRLWHDNWVFVPRGVRFIITVTRTAEYSIKFTLVYPVDGSDVIHEYEYTVGFLEYSVSAAVPSVLV